MRDKIERITSMISPDQKVRWIDLDEVLFETIEGVLQYHNYQLNGVPTTKEDITDYHFYRIPKLNMSKEAAVGVFNEFLHSEKVDDIAPIIWAKETLEALKRRKTTLVGITWRLASYEWWTQKALQRYYTDLLIDTIFLDAYSDITSSHVTKITKSEVCKEIWAKVMVEDDLHYAEELAANGIKVYLLDQPRNKQHQNGMHPNIIKVASWQEIAKYENL